MRKSLFIPGILILLILGVSSNSFGDNQWVPIGPYGGLVIALAINPQAPDTLYAAGEGGVFKSTNGGTNWTRSNTGLPNTQVYNLAINPQTPDTLYAGIYGYGVFKSTNGGANWTAINSVPYPNAVNAIAIDPQRPDTLYAFGEGVFKSTNGGTSWTAINTGLLPNTYVNALAIDPQRPDTLYAGMWGNWGNALFKSTNGGMSWTFNTGLPYIGVHVLAVDPQRPDTLYAETDAGVLKSTDGGMDWIVIGLKTGVNALAINPQAPDTLYAAGGGVFKSTNGGTNWTSINTGLSSIYVHALAINPQTPDTLYAGTYDGLFKSTNGGTDWTPINTGFSSIHVYTLAIDPKAPDTLYAGTYDGLFKSTNGGTNWTATGLTSTDVHALAINPQAPETLYAGSASFSEQIGFLGWGVFKSTDGGTSWCWTAVSNDLTNAYVSAIAIDPQIPGTLYAGTDGGGVYKSSNGGMNWTAINTGLTNTFVNTLAINPQTPETLYAGTGSGVFKLVTESISAPSTPDGPASGTTGTSYSYSTGAAASNFGNPVEYQFDWNGDGSSDLSGWGSASQSKSWTAAGVYVVRARARSATDVSAMSGWSNPLTVRISPPESISTPTTPDGPGSGKTDTSYYYSTGGATSSSGNPVEYQFDWKGDGSSDLSAWGSVSQSKAWTVAGVYGVKARARSATNVSAMSGWSNPLTVRISLPKISVTPTAYDFGNVKAKRMKTASFSIKNKGTVDLVIAYSVVGSDASSFAIAAGSGNRTIKPGKSLTVKVMFRPTSTGSKAATLQITSNDPVTPTVDIPLSGTGQ